MKLSSTAIKLFSASTLLFVSSAALAECATLKSHIIVDNIIPSLAGKQCSCICTINPFTPAMGNKFQTDSGGKLTFVSSCDNQPALKTGPSMPCTEVASAPAPRPSPTVSGKKTCYKLNGTTAIKTGCGCVCSDTPLTTKESIQLSNPPIVASCPAVGSGGVSVNKICDKNEALPAQSNTLMPQIRPLNPPK